RELVPLRRVFDSLDQLQISMAGLSEWLRHWIVAPVYESSILSSRPKLGGSYKGITHGLQPCNASSSLAPSTKVWLGNSAAECWSEKPVDTVQFRAEPPVLVK